MDWDALQPEGGEGLAVSASGFHKPAEDAANEMEEESNLLMLRWQKDAEEELEREEEEQRASRALDGWYSWVVCACAFTVHFSLFGLLLGFGVFLNPIAEEFGVGTGTVAWVISTANALMLSLGFFTGMLSDNVGPRWLVFVGGCLTGTGLFAASFTTEVWQMMVVLSLPLGVGMSLSILPSLATVSQWFEKNRSLATGLAVAGTGMGTVFFPIIAEYLLQRHGWRWSFRMFAEAFTIMILLAALLLKRRVVVKRTRRLDVVKYFRSRFLWLLMLAVFCTSFGYMIPYVHIIPYAETFGIPAQDAAFVVSAMGLASTVGRVGTGFCADKLGRLPVMRVCSFILAVDAFLWFFCSTLRALVLFGCIYGFASGALITVLPPLCAEYFGLADLTTMLGIVFTSAGIGFLIGPPLAGYTYDLSGSYNISILIAGITLSCGCLFFLLLPKSKKAEPTVAVAESPVMSYGAVAEEEVFSGHEDAVPSLDLRSTSWVAVNKLSPRTESDTDTEHL